MLRNGKNTMKDGQVSITASQLWNGYCAHQGLGTRHRLAKGMLKLLLLLFNGLEQIVGFTLYAEM